MYAKYVNINIKYYKIIFLVTLHTYITITAVHVRFTFDLAADQIRLLT